MINFILSTRFPPDSERRFVAQDSEEANSQELSVDVAQPETKRAASFYIVGMGGSAGGLEAFQQFFSRLPQNSGLAFVVVSHLEPSHKGMMPQLLARHTRMKVVEAQDGMQAEPNCVYVIPSNADLSIFKGAFQILDPVAPRGLRLPIDFFFRNMASDFKEKAIGIVFSGMGSDGTQGLRAIKANLGMTMVQDPASAKYDAMPRSVINTGLADYTASAEELPSRLLDYVRSSGRMRGGIDADEGATVPPLGIQKIFSVLRVRTGNDFSCYKRSMVDRRIERRLSLHQFERLPQYIRYLRENPQEVELLYKELLIGVTNFFRDRELFDFLKETAVPQLLSECPKGEPLRVWNPGCSTGEETYSLAIAIRESMEKMGILERPPVQIFATDIDKDAIEKARQGNYPPSIAVDVSPERLDRFFVHQDGTYRVKKDVRETAIFAIQNILVDPPFTKVDILCCRNFLIYINSETQKKIIPLFHYALKPGGLLVLGTAETAGGFDDLFSVVDKHYRVYQRKEPARRTMVEIPMSRLPVEGAAAEPMESNPKEQMMDDTLFSAQRALLDLYGPPAVVVNAEGDILYFNGRTGLYLEPPSGRVRNNLFAMAREGLREEIVGAMQRAVREKFQVTMEGVRVKTNGDFTTIRVKIKPLADPVNLRDMFLVVFEKDSPDGASSDENAGAAGEKAGLGDSSEANEELRRIRERLQNTIEEMNATQEELRSANEEMQSNNEELQSTNEELTSSKEELQSLNEEMQSVNSELQLKNTELSQSNSDMRNLLNGLDIATIFLDNNLNIKRFTSTASRIVNLVGSDVGRPIIHFATNLKYDLLIKDTENVLETLVPVEKEIQSRDERWYNMRILPYRTVDNRIDGVVITFADITVLKRLNEELQQARRAADEASGLAATVAQLKTTEETLRKSEEQYRALVTASSEVLYRMSPDWSEMRQLHSRGFLADMPKPSKSWLRQYIPPDEQPAVLAAIRKSINSKSVFELEHRVLRADGAVGWAFSRAVPLMDSSGAITEWFGAATDVTSRKQAEEELRQNPDELNQSRQQSAEDLAAATCLHALSAKMAGDGDGEFGLLMQEIVDAAIEISAADMGNLQIYDDGTKTLRIGAQRGFEQPFLDHFASVDERRDAVCGEAMKKRKRIVIEDIETSAFFKDGPSLDVLRAAGVRATQSTPLLSRAGRLVGMLSTHWRSAHHPEDRTLRNIDLLARQAADFLDRVDGSPTSPGGAKLPEVSKKREIKR